MDYKEFYIWLDGYLTNRLESEKIEIGPIIEKMSTVNVDNENKVNIRKFDSIPIPVNPIKVDPSKPYWDIEY